MTDTLGILTYKKLSTPPENAIKQIDGGRLIGFSDINAQWRIEALTEMFGLCGVGWYFERVKEETFVCESTQEIVLYVDINLYYKLPDGKWSKPIPGRGGDFLIVKEKKGLHVNDEAYKMATTDALGTAAKMIGVGADIYRGTFNKNSKYQNQGEPQTIEYATAAQVAQIQDLAPQKGVEIENILKGYKVANLESLLVQQALATINNLQSRTDVLNAVNTDR